MSLTEEETPSIIAYDKEATDCIYYDENDDKGATEAYGDLYITPDPNKSEFIYIVGKSGDGKSWTCRDIAYIYRKLFPNNKIYLITQTDESKIKEERRIFTSKEWVNKLKLTRIYVNQEFVDKPIDIEKQFNNCLIIYDDFLYFDSKDKINKVCKHIEQVLTLGRKHDIYAIITAHMLYTKNNQELYSIIQTEIHKMIWFRGANKGQLRYCLEKYWDKRPKEITKLINYDKKSRWICLNKDPSAVISQNKCELFRD